MAVTWANIKTLFYGTIGDVEGTNTFFSTAQVAQWAVDCLREVGERTQCRDLKTVNVGTGGVGTISFSGVEVYGVWRVEVDEVVMRPTTADKLRANDRFWETRADGVARWYLLDEQNTDVGTTAIRLYETPASDYNFVVYSYGAPATPNDTYPTYNIHLPEWFAYCLVYGMLAKAFGADTQMRNDEIAAFYNMVFEDAILRLRVRSFGRLKNEWEYSTEEQGIAFSIWDRLPPTIPEP